jgi:O-antigen/teichoic acid export membrane protein
MLEKISATLASRASLGFRFGSGFLFSIVGAFFNSGSTFLVNIAVANLLGRETFGEFAIIQNTLLTLATVGSLAAGYTATKYIAEFRSTDKAKCARVLALCSVFSLSTGIVFTLALLIGAPWLAGTVLRASHLSVGIRLAACVVFFFVHNFYQTGALAGLEGYAGIAKAGIIAGISYFLLCVAGTLVWGRNGALAGLSASAGVQWLALSFFLRRERIRQGIGMDYRGIRQEREVILRFTLPAALSGLSSMPALWLSNAFLVRQVSGYSQMALYAAATNLRVLILLLPQLINNVGMSLLNNAKGSGDAKRYRKVFWVNLGMSTIVTVVSAAFMAIFGLYVLPIYGRGFDQGYPVLLVLMASTIIEVLTIAVFQTIQTQARMWLSLFVVSLPRDTLIILMAYWLAPGSGATGLALAYTTGWTVALCATVVIAGMLERQHPQRSLLFAFSSK